MAPPPDAQFVPWVTASDDLDAAASAAHTSGDNGPGFDIENVGGAIEGWMRKMATRASKAATAFADHGGLAGPSGQGPRQPRGTSHAVGMVVDGGVMGDLIELTDSFEVGGEDPEHDDERSTSRAPAGGASSASSGVGSGRLDVTDRVRDRGRGWSASRAKSGKGD